MDESSELSGKDYLPIKPPEAQAPRTEKLADSTNPTERRIEELNSELTSLRDLSEMQKHEQPTSVTDGKVPREIQEGQETKDGKHPLLDGYFRIKEFERNPKFYERLGVKIFRDYMPLPTLGLRKYFVKPIEINETGLEKQEKLAKENEVIHLALGTAINGIAAAYYAMTNFPVGVLVIEGANLLLNGYPFMLQRYNRIRIEKVLTLLKKRKESNASPSIPKHVVPHREAKTA